MFRTRIEPIISIYMIASIYPIDKKNQSTILFTLLFPSTAAPLVVADGWWFNDDESLKPSGQIG